MCSSSDNSLSIYHIKKNWNHPSIHPSIISFIHSFIHETHVYISSISSTILYKDVAENQCGDHVALTLLFIKKALGLAEIHCQEHSSFIKEERELEKPLIFFCYLLSWTCYPVTQRKQSPRVTGCLPGTRAMWMRDETLDVLLKWAEQTRAWGLSKGRREAHLGSALWRSRGSWWHQW